MRKSKVQDEMVKNIRVWLGLSLLLYLTIEAIGSIHLVERLHYLMGHMEIFLINYALILTVTAPCLLFSHMLFVFSAFSVGIMSFAFANRVMIMIRGLPIRWADLSLMKETASIGTRYISAPLVCIIILIIISAIIILVQSYALHSEVNRPMAMISFLIAATCINGVTVTKAAKVDELKEASSPKLEQEELDYSPNGMLYGFLTSCEDNKIEAPVDYSKEKINHLKQTFKGMTLKGEKAEQTPNIIFLQVESFIDPYSLKGVTYSEDPIPCMRPYIEGETGGKLLMPDMNTARTEFEILTGMRLADLFKYEVPYTSSKLDSRPMESIAQILKQKGYHTTALHDNNASFYNRPANYKKLGFDNFVSLEQMSGISYFGDWPKDEIFMPYIKETLENTASPDFLFVVTVGTHSSYHYNYENPESNITIKGDLAQSSIQQLQDYIDRLQVADEFVGQMIDFVQKEEEPTILVVYGDHIPTLDVITYDSDYEKYEVPYFILSNTPLEKGKIEVQEALPAYKLYTQVLSKANLEGGILSNFHIEKQKDQDYYHELDLISYDLLLGEQYLVNGKNPYSLSNLQMGVPKKE